MKRGFSLIEILVVIAIIAILTTLLLPNYIESRQRAKDIQRKSDLKQLQTALELYKQNQNPQVYPDTIPNLPCTAWSLSGVIYMNKVPKEPSSNCSSPLKYYYSTNGDNTTYTLAACLENISDPDLQSCPTGTYNFTDVAGYSCISPRSCYIVTQP